MNGKKCQVMFDKMCEMFMGVTAFVKFLKFLFIFLFPCRCYVYVLILIEIPLIFIIEISLTKVDKFFVCLRGKLQNERIADRNKT